MLKGCENSSMADDLATTMTHIDDAHRRHHLWTHYIGGSNYDFSDSLRLRDTFYWINKPGELFPGLTSSSTSTWSTNAEFKRRDWQIQVAFVEPSLFSSWTSVSLIKTRDWTMPVASLGINPCFEEPIIWYVFDNCNAYIVKLTTVSQRRI